MMNEEQFRKTQEAFARVQEHTDNKRFPEADILLKELSFECIEPNMRIMFISVIARHADRLKEFNNTLDKVHDSLTVNGMNADHHLGSFYRGGHRTK